LAVDFDKHAAATYAANFPGVDVRCGRVGEIALPYADIIVGGPPCQPFSDAGANAGEHDPRDCIPDFIAAVKVGQPRMFLMENVRGLLKKKHLVYLASSIEAMTAAGYRVEWKLLDAVNFGVPQFRKRVWFWGIRNDLFAAGMRWAWPRESHVWPIVVGADMFDGALLPGVTVGEALGLYAVGQADRIKLADEGAGNANRWEKGPSPSVDGHGLDGVQYRWSDAMLTKHPPASPASPAPTVQAKWFKGGAEGLVEIADNAKHQPHQPANALGAGGDGHGMSAANMHIVASSPAMTLASGNNREPFPNEEYRKLWVRRLTPMECLRLQSGPDDFKWPEKITKTAQYRIVGNGWAPKMGHVFAQAFATVDPAAETVIDLFCGGGLGACGWHGRYWELTIQT